MICTPTRRLHGLSGEPVQAGNELCRGCEELWRASQLDQKADHIIEHHISSLLGPSKLCPLCWQLLQWAGLDTSELWRKPDPRSSIYIEISRLEGPEAFHDHGISRWQLRRSWIWGERPAYIKLRMNDHSPMEFVITHSRGPTNWLASRPLWAGTQRSFEERIVTVQKWLQRCGEQHPGCYMESSLSRTRDLPARIIDVGNSEDIDVALVNSQAVEGTHRYLALSYCWGAGGIPIRTTKSNLTKHERGLQVQVLPQTLQDAIKICKLLGFRYLWIDSLCIVQDDRNDWESEAAKMASIFHCADLIICAASASDCTQGCGIERIIEPASEYIIHNSKNASDEEGRPNSPEGTTMLIRQKNPSIEQLQTCPVQSRGWIFQELFLAKRVLYLLEGHMIWQCHNLLESEDCELSRTSYLHDGKVRPGGVLDKLGVLSSGPLYDLQRQLTRDAEVRVWWDILSEFLHRQFTYPGDALPALAGLIALWQSFTSDEPVLGLWKRNLPLHMCWYVNSEAHRIPGLPSWCWTSITYPDRRYIRNIYAALISPSHIIWQANIHCLDIQWEGQKLSSTVEHARVSLYRTRATTDEFGNNSKYLPDHTEEMEFNNKSPEVIPLVIAKPGLSYPPIPDYFDKFRMLSLIVRQVDAPDGKKRFRRIGLAYFLSSRIYATAEEVAKRANEIVNDMEVIELVELV